MPSHASSRKKVAPASKKTSVSTSAKGLASSKAALKKTVAKKATTKKAVAKKAASKSPQSQKTSVQKKVVVTKSASSKKPLSAKPSSTKTAPKKVAPKKVAASSLKKEVSKSSVSKPTTRPKTASVGLASLKSSAKKSSAKKSSAKKSSAKKSSAKKSSVKKPAAKPVSKPSTRSSVSKVSKKTAPKKSASKVAVKKVVSVSPAPLATPKATSIKTVVEPSLLQKSIRKSSTPSTPIKDKNKNMRLATTERSSSVSSSSFQETSFLNNKKIAIAIPSQNAHHDRDFKEVRFLPTESHPSEVTDPGFLTNDDVFDETDHAQWQQLREQAAIHARAINLNKPETHPDFDGTHCIECDEEIPPARLKLQKVRCVDCQNDLENKDRHNHRHTAPRGTGGLDWD